MTQEIYFDGNLMDIDESTKITLSIKNNLFTEIKKCVGNRTYTVQFPKTAHNLRIIKYAHLPQSDSDIPYNYHTAAYIRNGITIFDDGIAYIVSVKDKIEVCMVWGIPAVLKRIFTGDMKLNEITDDGKTATYVRYNQVTPWSNLVSARENNGYCYAAIDFLDYTEGHEINQLYNTNEATSRMPKMGYLRPSVFVWHILERLSSVYKIGFLFDNADIEAWVKLLLIPCITENADVVSGSIKFDVTDHDHWTASRWNSDVYISNGEGDWSPGVFAVSKMDVSTVIDYHVVFPYRLTENNMRRILNQDLLRVQIGGNSTLSLVPPTINIFVDGNPWNRDSTTNNEYIFEIHLIGIVRDVLTDRDSATSVNFIIDGYQVGYYEYGSIIFAPTIKSAYYGTNYQLTMNFPDCKVVEFLEWFAALTGMFPVQNHDATRDLELVFVPYTRFFNNKANAVDWSSKLVRAYNDGAAREISYTTDGWAQVNKFAYKEDEEIGTFADGEIRINNVQLEEEQEIAGDTFAATKPYNNVPLYSTNESDDYDRLLAYIFPSEDETGDLLEPTTCDWRVLMAMKLTIGNADYIQGVFDESLWWSRILADARYQKFVASIQRTKILNEVFALTELDIKQFDETIPVYLAQYGHYYAVLEIKTSETGVSEVTLFQLEL